MMRRIDDELVKLGHERVFFQSPEHPFRNALDWGTRSSWSTRTTRTC